MQCNSSIFNFFLTFIKQKTSVPYTHAYILTYRWTKKNKHKRKIKRKCDYIVIIVVVLL